MASSVLPREDIAASMASISFPPVSLASPRCRFLGGGSLDDGLSINLDYVTPLTDHNSIIDRDGCHVYPKRKLLSATHPRPLALFTIIDENACRHEKESLWDKVMGTGNAA
jgi:hypothetical protein